MGMGWRWSRAVLAGLFLLAAGCATAGGGSGGAGARGGEEESAYPPYAGVKKRIAVLAFENKVAERWYNESWNIESSITEMLVTELMKTGRFVVLERGSLAEVVGEQDLGAGGRVRAETAARVGELLGAQLLVKGAVTEFSE